MFTITFRKDDVLTQWLFETFDRACKAALIIENRYSCHVELANAIYKNVLHFKALPQKEYRYSKYRKSDGISHTRIAIRPLHLDEESPHKKTTHAPLHIEKRRPARRKLRKKDIVSLKAAKIPIMHERQRFCLDVFTGERYEQHDFAESF